VIYAAFSQILALERFPVAEMTFKYFTVTGRFFLAKRDYTLRLANGMANPTVCLSVVCDFDVHARGFNFSGIFLHHIVAWPSGKSPTKNHEDRPRG